MPRIARIIAPHFPHHITQRGNRRQQVFFKDEDYNEYLRLLKFHSDKFNLSIVAYCLMPNHVHLIVIPGEKESIAKAIGETHRKYTRMINFRNNWRGYPAMTHQNFFTTSPLITQSNFYKNLSSKLIFYQNSQQRDYNFSSKKEKKAI